MLDVSGLQPEEKGCLMSEYLATRYEELHYIDFYREIFQHYLETQEQRDNREKFCYSALCKVIFEKLPGEQKQLHHKFIITDDLVSLGNAVSEEGEITLLAPVDYVGKSAKAKSAVHLYAIAIDLDNLIFEQNHHMTGLLSLISQYERAKDYLPVPTLIVSSGSGLHVYYVFEQPIRLTKPAQKALSKLRTGLTRRLWNSFVTHSYENIQYEPLLQDLRMVGSKNKYGGVLRGFKVGGRVTVDYLNSFMDEQFQANFEESHITLAAAKAKYPEWYQERIIEKKPRSSIVENRWHINKNKKKGDRLALYHWWYRTAWRGCKVGHRYNCLKGLAILAMKNEVPEEEFLKDLEFLGEEFEKLTNDEKNHLTEADIKAAKKFYYDENYNNYPAKILRYRSGIDFAKPLRNGQKQVWHLEDLREKKNKMKVRGIPFKSPEGRPKGSKSASTKAAEKIKAWRAAHPDGRKIDCERETGVSRHTVIKWWDKIL